MRDPNDTQTVELVAARIGYGRKSKDEQEMALQVDALKRAGCDQIYLEQVSRAGPKREKKGATELEQAIKACRRGDTLVVWRLDRLAGSITELIRIVTKELPAKGVAFESLSETIDTTSAPGKMFFHVCCIFAEYERNVLIERTHAGLRAARLRGRIGGRPRALNGKQVREMLAMVKDPSISIADIARTYKVSRTTVYKYLDEAQEGAKQ